MAVYYSLFHFLVPSSSRELTGSCISFRQIVGNVELPVILWVDAKKTGNQLRQVPFKF